jgi:hypothetical protein
MDRENMSDRDIDKSESESSFGQKIGQSESWGSEPSGKSGSSGSKWELDESSEVDDPECSGCYY